MDNANLQNNSNVNNNNTIYKVLAYMGILWLVGLLGKGKDDESVKFHVGQGMILTIASVILYIIVSLINNLLITNIFKETLFGITIGVSPTGLAIMGILNLAVTAFQLTFMIIGIVNVNKGTNKKLPIIGSFAFYK